MTVFEFWDQTPRETYLVIDAALWRDRQNQRHQIVLAWRTAALTRAKKLPSLKQLLNDGPAKPLVGRELKKRRQEFQEMSAAVDLGKIAEAMKKKTNDRIG